ncbi:MAG: choice-of-anchor I family protein [Planctomycetaceae bacterium]
MRILKKCISLSMFSAALWGWSESIHAELIRIGGLSTPNVAEIASYDPLTNRLFTTTGGGAAVIEFGDGTNLSNSATTIDVSSLFSGDLSGVSSITVDPNGRGFGVLTAIPNDNTGTLGKAVLFNTSTGAILKELDVGFHPDMVTFTPDGQKILIANEGEANSTSDAPGSISVIDVSGVATVGDVGTLSNANVTTKDFSASNLGPGVPALSSLRINPANSATPQNDLEPEYISVKDGKAYVSLQEANAVAVFDLASNTWEDIQPLGTIIQTIDASDQDSGISINDAVRGLPMPDTIGTFKVGDQTFYVTANEGDTRDPGFNVGDNGRMRANTTDADVGAALRNNATGIGRLTISLTDGNTDADPQIEIPYMFGTRSFSIWDASDGSLIFDSGSDFETITATEVPTLYNSELGLTGEFDKRSDNKGPEPEGLVIGKIYGTTYAFISLERTGGIMQYDITDPFNPFFVDYINTSLAHGTAAPEGLVFIPSATSPNGRNLLVAAYEASGGVEVFEIVGAVPEPSSMMLLGMGSIGLWMIRRRLNRKP